MKIVDFVWLDQFTEKLETKHGVYPDEVKAVFAHQPKIRRLEKGHVRGEDFYRALGQTSSGRYLAVFFMALYVFQGSGSKMARFTREK